MIQILELTEIQANIIAIVLPLIMVSVFILIIPSLRDGSSSTFRRYLSYSVKPPKIGSDKAKLYFYYSGIVLFLVSFMVSEFYEVILDLILPVTQGNTGEMREISTIVFQSPFNAGWIGSLPWLGRIMYHETWNWVYFTAAFTDNPDFLGTLNAYLTLFSIGVGIVFLAPLAIKTIRHSFLASMSFFTIGMAIFVKASVSSLAYAIALAFLNAELEFITIVATGSMIPDLWFTIVVQSLIVLAMFGFFAVLGRKLWRIYYPDSQSRTWFTGYIALNFLLGVIITILVV
ncbi:MAG: hypothetical protein ACFFFO_05125 [Candidatus Thorarchaeota archaeon]